MKHEESSTGASCLRRGPPPEQINEPSAESPGEKPCAAVEGETALPTLTFQSQHTPPCGFNEAISVKPTFFGSVSVFQQSSHFLSRIRQIINNNFFNLIISDNTLRHFLVIC